MKSEKILIVGATSSLAQAIAQLLAKQGNWLVLAGRDDGELELLASDVATRFATGCTLLVADFMDANFSPETFITQAGDFDHAVIAVGDMGDDLASAARINYIVPAQIGAAAAEYLSAKKTGTIVIISSVAGDRGRGSNIAYGAAKAALTAFASGLRNRFHASGVHVMTVKPGFIDTPMTWGMNSPLIASREYVAEKIVHAMQKKKDVIYVPFFWRWIMLIICNLPERIFKRLSL